VDAKNALNTLTELAEVTLFVRIMEKSYAETE
jgi:hypothetical protein